ncbi:hypothetical protein GCM10023075_74280 [Streptosporangium album]
MIEVAVPRAESRTSAVTMLSRVGKSTAVPAAARASPSSAVRTDPARASTTVPAAAVTAPAIRTVMAWPGRREPAANRVRATTAAKTAGPVAASVGAARSMSAR